MKLPQALVLRADTNKRLDQMRARLIASAIVQEGDVLPEDPIALLVELDALTRDFERLVVAINRTNTATTLPGVGTLTLALARRDALDKKFNLLSALLEAVTTAVLNNNPRRSRVGTGTARFRLESLEWRYVRKQGVF